MATTTSKTVQSLAISQAASQNEGMPSLLQTFQAHVEDMRNLVLCKICIRPLYEPYTLGCGHTYCYSCLTSWFAGAPARRKKMNCPDCRASVTVQPSPNYLLRDLVHMFISRVELLPEDETTAQHDEAKRIEAQLIESDRATRANGEPGLFKGVFSRTRLGFGGVIRDEEDGVDRCPICAWEMEDGECGHCGYLDHDEAWSDEEEHEDGTIDSQSVISIQSSTMDGGDDPRDNPFLNHLLGGQAPSIPDDFREWERRDQAARLARRTMRGVERHRRYGTASTADTHDYLMDHYEEHSEDSAGSEGDDEIAAFLERHPIDDTRWDTSTAETVDEDEEMTSAMDDEDAESAESTTSFHRAAILARDNGMNPPFSSDISTNASDGEEDGETATHDSNGSDESERSEDDEDTPEATPTVHRLANRPARIIIDSEDESDEDGSSSEEDDEDNEGDEEEDEDGETDDDSTPSPPRPAAARQARVQMHRGRRGTRGRGRGRGRPRTRG